MGDIEWTFPFGDFPWLLSHVVAMSGSYRVFDYWHLCVFHVKCVRRSAAHQPVDEMFIFTKGENSKDLTYPQRLTLAV
ncbi:hypothetical protein IF2G_06229 [Cordyceps javanica]|nr:hypothetical protein IF2G_06229 [Cordyceps javanica]